MLLLMDTNLRRRLSRSARRQHGIVTREELRGLGLTDHTIDWALATSQLVALFPGVYRANGAPDTWHGRALAAQRRVERQLRRLDPAGATPPLAAIGGDAAAHLHGLPGHGRAPKLTVVTSRRSRSRSIPVLFRPSLTEADVGEIDRVPVTSLAWTGVATAARSGEADRRDLLTHLVGTGRLRHGQLVGAAHRADVAGQAAVLDLLRSMTGTVSHYRSGTERRLVAACVDLGLPSPLANHRVRTTAGPGYELDAVWLDARLDVEVDGPHHLLPSQRRRDRIRDRHLRDDGFEVARFPVEEVDDDPVEVAERIAAILARREPAPS